MIYWELFDFEYQFENLLFGIFLNIGVFYIGYNVYTDLKKRKKKISPDTIHFYCILISVK
jgi:hypothetical protein